jgi:hypothetical protein
MTPFHQLAARFARPLSRPIRILMACSFAAWMSYNLTNPAIAQERLEQQIAEMKEKLHRESQGLKQHIAELMESGQVDKAEATKRELANFQQSMEEKIHATAARLDSPEQNPQRAEAKRRPKERELKAPREEANPEADRQLRQWHEELTQAIKQRQPDRIMEISHRIANHVREAQVHDGREMDRPGPKRPREGRPFPNGPGPEATRELHMMVQELRGELQQLRRELDELRRERH